MEKKNEGSSSFPIGETPQERNFSYVPECYRAKPNHWAGLLEAANIVDMPQINLDGLDDPAQRSRIVQEIADACRRYGFLQVTNHGISQQILEGALSSASAFFELPNKDKAKYMSNDMFNPVRYGTSLKDGLDKVQYWRVFLKHYANPLEDWIKLWPDNPPDYREKMGEYCLLVQKLAVKMMSAITEGLNLGPTYLTQGLCEGMQVVAVNCYPPCPEPEKTLGLPPHSDYACLTVVLQDSSGLQVLDSQERTWKTVPAARGALQVHVGDHLEVLSNGRYKSVVHRVAVSRERARVSIVSLESLGMNVGMRAAKELVDEDGGVCRYRESSFRDFLEFISKNDVAQRESFLSSLKI